MTVHAMTFTCILRQFGLSKNTSKFSLIIKFMSAVDPRDLTAMHGSASAEILSRLLKYESARKTRSALTTNFCDIFNSNSCQLIDYLCKQVSKKLIVFVRTSCVEYIIWQPVLPKAAHGTILFSHLVYCNFKQITITIINKVY